MPSFWSSVFPHLSPAALEIVVRSCLWIAPLAGQPADDPEAWSEYLVW
jgi:hypothetical protein